jgi:uncharacterized phiE125 gp8 family phage protein
MIQAKHIIKVLPTELPISVAELKGFLRLSHSLEDEILSSMIEVARSYIESYCNVTLTETTHALWLDYIPVNRVELYRPRITSIERVFCIDESGIEHDLAVSDYKADLKDLIPFLQVDDFSINETLQSYNSFCIEYKAGGLAADVDKRLKLACKILSAHLYENRELITFANIKKIPFSLQCLLDQIRIPRF